MIVQIKVHPRSSKEEIVKINTGFYKVYMHEPAIGGRANEKLIEMVARHFGTKKNRVRIISGLKARNKVVGVA